MADDVHILLVDDREDGLIALESVLADTGYRLVRANSGAEALERVREMEFSVILLDVQMPLMDGFETARRIKAGEANCHTPIIFVTAINKDETYVYRGYSEGAVDYVFKPFDPHVLRSKIDVFVDLRRKARQLEEQTDKIRTSERRERYLRLAELEVEALKRYRNLADSIPHALWRSKPDGTMDYFNRVWTSYTGLSEEQSLGGGWQRAFEPEDLRRFLRAWMAAMEKGDGFQMECRLAGVEGEFRWHWIKVVAERRPSGDVVSWLGTCTDIHERKEAEDGLNAARQEAEIANDAKTRFLANMSHEIRTPLNSILGFAELMRRPSGDPGEQARYLETIKRNGHSLLKIIDEILDISKVEADKLEIEMGEVDLRAMFAEVQSLLEVQAQEKRLDLMIRCSTPIPARVMTDSTRLRQVLINMIGNAIKFTETGNVGVDIAWLPEGATQGVLRCFVKDTGTGIDPDQAEKLFQPFVQADSSTSRRFGGTGLGLALSRRFAKALGGDVRLESSEPGKGSTFRVEVRAQVAAGSRFFEYADLHQETAQATSVGTELTLSGVQVLVVDDAKDNRILISRFLDAAGAKVDCASDGEEGVERAMAHDYHVILMDIQMPQLDGYGATSRLRDQGYRKPIIALTAHALKEERARSLHSGFDDHLTKPIDRNTLIKHVARLAGRVEAAARGGS